MKNILLTVSLVALLSLGIQTGIPAIDHDLIPSAEAVEMHSASPIESAGSASRIARRTSRGGQRHWAAGNQVTVLPSGCTAVYKSGGTYYDCGNTYYTAVFQGSDLVYVAVAKP